MQFILEWLQGQANLLTLFQITLELALTVLVVTLLVRKPKVVNPSVGEEFTASLDKIIQEARELGSDFEANLTERHKLIQQVTAELDSRLTEARAMCTQLASLQESAQQLMARPEPVKRNADHQEVLRLARKGLKVEAIARQLQKPVGEVELILKLNQLSGS